MTKYFKIRHSNELTHGLAIEPLVYISGHINDDHMVKVIGFIHKVDDGSAGVPEDEVPEEYLKPLVIEACPKP